MGPDTSGATELETSIRRGIVGGMSHCPIAYQWRDSKWSKAQSKRCFLCYEYTSIYISCWGHLKINFSFLYRYKFLLTNSKHSWDYLHYHFSADEFYILPILIVASGLHLFLLFTTTWFAIALKTRQLFHVTYKLFLITVLLHVSLIQKNILGDKDFSSLFHMF